MGYDISVKFKSVEEKDNMYNFLVENLDILKKLEKTDYLSFHIEPNINDNIGSYAPKKNRDKLISFHGTGIPLYAWDLCCWMAHKSFYKNKQGNSTIFYDSDAIEIYLNEDNPKNININEQGFRIRTEKSLFEKFRNHLIGRKEIKQFEILSELNDLWNKKLNNLNKPKM